MSVGAIVFLSVLLFAFPLCMVVYGITWLTKTDGSLLDRYDERQRFAQEKGYRAGFAVMAALMLLYAVSDTVLSLPIEPGALMVLFVLIGRAVVTGYCIWQDAWFPLNGKKPGLLFLNILWALLLVAAGFAELCSGRAFTGGKLNLRSWPLLLGVFILADLAVILLHWLVAPQNENEA